MKWNILWNQFWYYTNGVSIRTKFMGIVLLLILLFGLGMTFQVRNNLTAVLNVQLENQGVAVTRDLAARSTDLILTNNSFDLYQLLKDTVENNQNVRYALVLTPKGDILSHSFSDSIPVGLVEVNQIADDANFQLLRLNTDEGLVFDIAVPIFGGRAGIARVGMTTSLLQDIISAATSRWLIITGLVSLIGLVATYFLTSVLTRPIKDLVEVTKAITKGDLQRKAPVWAPDEVGELATAFNDMTESLNTTLSQREIFQAELLRRNLELSALNIISNELSRSQDLTDMMRRSLAKVIESLKLDAGWVSMLTDDGNHTRIICQQGISQETTQKLAHVNLFTCACGKAIRNKSPVIISSAEATCPIANHKLSNSQHLLCHVALPLISKSQVFGLLHVASSKSSQFTDDQIKLLSAIGHQMGVAIENSRLWDELKRKQEVRGQLLDETISAQEAERKRIARELHDQTGQSLTSIMMGLKALKSNGQKDIHKKIADLRQLTAQTLEDVHNLALELRPSTLDDLGLVTTLDQYTREYADKFGIHAEFQAIGITESLLSPVTEITLYRIIQEALTNVLKHAAASKVSVLLEARGTSLIVIVEDDGRGFDVRKVSVLTDNERKLGLHGMHERMTLIGGELTIESRPGKGTTIFAEVPIKSHVAK